jgi:hypothetical protein
MSGGPVMNDHGAVCGVVTTCMPGQGKEPHYSAVSLLVPAMGIEFDFQLPGDDTPRKYTLYELAKRGEIDVEGLEQVHVSRDPSTGYPVVEYTPKP